MDKYHDSPVDSMNLCESLSHITQVFLAEWQKAHGQIECTLAEYGFSMVIQDALTPAERNLAKEIAGRELIQRYFERLLESACPRMVECIETKLGCPISHITVEIEPETGCIHFHVVLRQNAGVQ
jgi:uncharacterized protein YbcI